MTRLHHHQQRRSVTRRLPAAILTGLLAGSLLLAACGDSNDNAGSTTTTVADSTTTSGPVLLAQPAIWPAADVVFTTPKAAAEDFVTAVLGVTPALGEFKQGDARSGEIEVLSLGEDTSATPVVRSLLLLRQLGPDDGWFIVAAVNDNETITAPASAAEVAAGPLTVEGEGRGFEANVVVTAFVAGSASSLSQVITQGGAFETPAPYKVTLDLSAATPGDTVMLLVRGGAGLETDPGDFAALPVVITG